jgi:hypothetical protein
MKNLRRTSKRPLGIGTDAEGCTRERTVWSAAIAALKVGMVICVMALGSVGFAAPQSDPRHARQDGEALFLGSRDTCYEWHGAVPPVPVPVPVEPGHTPYTPEMLGGCRRSSVLR